MEGPDGAEGSAGSRFDHRALERLVHSRIRLAVLSILAAVADAEFTYLRDQVHTTDGNLASHLRKLEEAGYVEAEKSFVDRKPVTRYRITSPGKAAFGRYVDRLERMLEPSEEA